jgi:hypothetical protein
MSDDLDTSLREALRPVDPGTELTRKVLAAVEQDAQRPPSGLRFPGRHSRWRWASVALTVALVVGLVTVHRAQVRHREQGLEARQQLIQALRVTSEKLDLAYRVVNDRENPEDGS